MKNNSELSPLDLKSRLEQSKLPLNEWTGKGGTKTIYDLLHEVEEGESEITFDLEGNIQRVVHVVVGDVYYIDREGNRLLRLKEDRQVSKVDGSVNQRTHLHGAVAEKMKVGEDVEKSVLRGIKEELGLEGDFKIQGETLIEETRTTSTYPGLNSIYKLHLVPVYIDKENYNPEGYIEDQEKKTNYFIWEEVNQVNI